MRTARASSTARLIAAGTVMAAREPNILAPPSAEAVSWCERLLSTTRTDRLLLFTARSRTGRAFWRLIERFTIPGIIGHWMQRKQNIEHAARQAASEGFTQLVVVGAGLDTLAFRLSEERVFENILALDHPATQAVIRRAIGESPTAETDVELIPVDLRAEGLAGGLARSGRFDSHRPTLFVMEGVLMYLPEPTVVDTLRVMSKVICPRKRFIASYMDAMPNQSRNRPTPIAFRPQSPIVALWLRVMGETTLWSAGGASLFDLLACTGWRLIETLSPANMNQKKAANGNVPEGENVFVAETL